MPGMVLGLEDITLRKKHAHHFFVVVVLIEITFYGSNILVLKVCRSLDTTMDLIN